MASFEEVYQALVFMMNPEETQQVMLERFHTRAQQPVETIRELHASLAKLARAAFLPHGENAPLLQRLIAAVRAPSTAMSFKDRPQTTIFEALAAVTGCRACGRSPEVTQTGLDACTTAHNPRPHQQAWTPRFNLRPRYTPQWHYNRDPRKCKHCRKF